MIRYLDLQIGVSSEGSLEVRPGYKDSKLKVVLDASSCHAPGVHKSWPTMMMQRIGARCFNTSISDAQAELVSHWVQCGMPGEKANAFLAAANRRVRSLKLGRNSQNSSRTLWIALPFFPAWMKALVKALRSMNRESVLLEMSYDVWKHFRLRPCWSNFLPSLENKVNGRR